MARETLTIVVESTGVLKATQGMNALGAASNRASTSASLVSRALQTVGGALILRQLARTADSYRNIANRIATVTSSHAEAEEVMKRVFDIANATRTSFESTGIVYARIANAATDLGKSHEQVLSLVKGLNQAMAIGGTTSREANAALIQFSQGLASGTLRGDELRSVLEQSVIVSEVLSRGLGVTRGELKKMGEQGKISSELIFSSFEKVSDELDKRFAELVPTLSQSFEVFKNRFTLFIGQLNESTKVTLTLGKALNWLGQNLEYVAKVIGLLLSRFILLKTVAPVLTLITTKFQVLTAVVSGLVSRAIVPLTAAIGTFGTVLKTALFVPLRAGFVGMVFGMDAVDKGIFGVLRGLKKLAIGLLTAPLKLFNARLMQTAITGRMVKKGLFGLTLGVRALTAALVLNPFMILWKTLVLLVKLIPLAVGGMVMFADKISVSADGVVKLSHFLEALWEEIVIGWQQLSNAVSGVVEGITMAFHDMGVNINLSFKGIVMFVGRMIDSIYQLFVFGRDNFVAAWKALPRMLGDIMVKSMNLMIEKYEEGINMLFAGVVRLGKIGIGMDPGLAHLGEEWIEQGAWIGLPRVSWTAVEDGGLEMGRLIIKGLEEAFKKTPVQDFIERVFTRMEDIAYRKPKKVSLDRGGIDRTKAAQEARKKLIDDFAKLEEALDPVLAAHRQLFEAEKLLDKAFEADLITLDRRNDLFAVQKRILEKALHPFDFMISKMREENELLRLDEDARKRVIAVREFEKRLVEAGTAANRDRMRQYEEELDIKERLIANNEAINAQKEREAQLLKQILGPAEEYADNMQALNAVWARGEITAQEYGKAIDDLKLAYLDTRLDEQSGIERGLIRIKQDLMDVATVTEQVLTGAFNSAEDALTDMITGFTEGWDKGLENAKEAFKNFIDAVLQDLTRLLIRQALLNLLFSGATGSPPVISPGPGFAPLQHGGQWNVGGSGGPDSQIVAFRATPGEHVAVTPPGQLPAPQVAPPANVNVRVVNQVDPRESIDAMRTPAGEQVIMNAIRRNPGMVRRLVS